MEEMRLQKYLASCGVASRRKCEELILEGKVEVNGNFVTELGTKINPEKDEVKYNGNVVKLEEEKIYILLNKPIGYVTTVKEQFGRDMVLDLVKVNKRIVPVGRLDMYTSGALILTNDGEFVNKLTHPSHEIDKTYNVTLKGIVTKEDIENLKNGVEIDDGYITKPAKAKILKIDEEFALDFDVLGYLDPNITVCIIKDGKLVEKKKLQLPQKIINVEKCKNPRCITSVEQGLDHVFYLANKDKRIYRCLYCETKVEKK